ncbi:hypothetical protein BV898_02142 [Hypsibius exemplaris]|uniref:Uncharacterized protein n=1 Tax=Hypsibius exemplaris TaxID=2072580 RepID=A0A1W0X9I3_HYPEX|nr:hypothetical protein BV898_02142 [Hypsibius exemplaris]
MLYIDRSNLSVPVIAVNMEIWAALQQTLEPGRTDTACEKCVSVSTLDGTRKVLAKVVDQSLSVATFVSSAVFQGLFPNAPCTAESFLQPFNVSIHQTNCVQFS